MIDVDIAKPGGQGQPTNGRIAVGIFNRRTLRQCDVLNQVDAITAQVVITGLDGIAKSQCSGIAIVISPVI